jgi:hypothetical protein
MPSKAMSISTSVGHLTWKVLTKLCVESCVPELGTWRILVVRSGCLIRQHKPRTQELGNFDLLPPLIWLMYNYLSSVMSTITIHIGPPVYILYHPWPTCLIQYPIQHPQPTCLMKYFINHSQPTRLMKYFIKYSWPTCLIQYFIIPLAHLSNLICIWAHP